MKNDNKTKIVYHNELFEERGKPGIIFNLHVEDKVLNSDEFKKQYKVIKVKGSIPENFYNV